MPGPLFAESSAVLKSALAAQMGCSPSDYESHEITVVVRPPDSREPHLALMTTCGTGSVVSVRDPRLGDWVRAQEIPAHRNQWIFRPRFLEGLAAHARELGHVDAKSHGSSGGTVLAEEIEPPALATGFSLRELSIAEQAALRVGNRFNNALGDEDEFRRIAASRTAFAAVAPDGSVAAVVGISDQYPGIDEIGLDVSREYRGLGLAPALTLHATRWIREQGRQPIYTYGFTNVRSANNALRCGYRPLWFLSAVFVPADMH
ncbi:MAG: GNAT family N-acetyltransferase [bacterium]